MGLFDSPSSGASAGLELDLSAADGAGLAAAGGDLGQQVALEQQKMQLMAQVGPTVVGA
jgi:hypothetical protein